MNNSETSALSRTYSLRRRRNCANLSSAMQTLYFSGNGDEDRGKGNVRATKLGRTREREPRNSRTAPRDSSMKNPTQLSAGALISSAKPPWNSKNSTSTRSRRSSRELDSPFRSCADFPRAPKIDQQREHRGSFLTMKSPVTTREIEQLNNSFLVLSTCPKISPT